MAKIDFHHGQMRDSIHKATTPRKWEEFLEFLEICPKIDVVVDIMNVRRWRCYEYEASDCYYCDTQFTSITRTLVWCN